MALHCRYCTARYFVDGLAARRNISLREEYYDSVDIMDIVSRSISSMASYHTVMVTLYRGTYLHRGYYARNISFATSRY